MPTAQLRPLVFGLLGSLIPYLAEGQNIGINVNDILFKPIKILITYEE